jgi:BNR/Asp-box repeat protein
MGRRGREAHRGGPAQTALSENPQRRPLVGLLAAAVLALAAAAAVAYAVVDGSDNGGAGGGGGGADLSHVHGLGINPKDGALYIATHTGMFRAAKGETKASRFGESEQDVMGFSVLGPDRFLGSGHPGPLQGGPSNLGLLRSDDAGRNWESVSLLGESDFHVLRSRDPMVYGFDASNARFLVSSDRGRRWQEREVPGPMLDLAVHPGDPARVVASTGQGLATSGDAGRSWRKLQPGPLALLTWPEPSALYRVEGSGRISRSGDQGRTWKATGSIGAQPAAFASAATELYAALPDGTVKRSTDGGQTWSIRATP